MNAAPSGVERRSIDVIPAGERHGRPMSQFTLWFGANMQITALVDGALAVVFGADALWAIIGLTLGNILGGAVMALHSAQGPRLGLPQMISSRAQFGVVGAIIPLVLVVLMYLGFASTGTVLSGQAINRMVGATSPAFGIVVFGVITAVVAIVGYRWIHALGRIATVTGILGWLWLAYKLFTSHDVASFFAAPSFNIVTFLLATSLGAGWQLTYGPYVADYSRYLPQDTPDRVTFWATFSGSVLGSSWSMALGVLIASVPGSGFLKNQVGFLGDLSGGGTIAIVLYLVIVIGKLTVNTLNAYGGSMTMLTTVSAFQRSAVIPAMWRAIWICVFIVASVLVALLASADFLNNFKNFVLVLLMVFTPWSAINLVDYYLVSRERVDIPALYDPKGRYGAWNWPTLAIYSLGVLAQIPFLAQTMYTGPLTKMLGGTDISWIVGLFLTAAVYYPVAKRTQDVPEQMIFPVGSDLGAEEPAPVGNTPDEKLTQS
ncbi:purine-cytosine permease family protein [Austwickia chelonae]|uniref:purine-cytosine permease family protein n=1 Tax=Austwickia chelonae TaxID=100225 RepID=UPI000E28A0F3|nr:cytosine permease [Austwickia chelonae]